jgi:hypothetical protein
LECGNLNIFDNIYQKGWRLGALLGIYPRDRLAKFSTTDLSEGERNESDLHRLFYGNDGPIVHKWKHYLSIYARHLESFRNKPVRFLEIGVFKGGSMRLWRRYFGTEATIFGVDIDPSCAVFDGQDAQVRIGSQADPEFLQKVVSEMGGIDIVLDDGSHVSSHQRASFQCLFPKLSDGGLYICEDLHANYWRGWCEGGYKRKTTFIETCKRLVDDLHSDFHSHGRDEISKEIAGIHFYNSIVVIEKGRQPPPTHIMIGR